MTIQSLLIANRGEIAVRVIRAARELGIRTIQVHSDADAGSLAVQLADEAYNIGPPQAAKSYLNAEKILEVALQSGADAIHPGYGFLSENADFTDAVENAGMVYVGPSGNTIRMMGDKVVARQAAAAAGVPVIPGSDGRIDDMNAARKLAQEVGFPVMIKAAAGGGGRGIRVISSVEEFDREAPKASAEAKSAFGDGGLYLEKFIEKGRHIEVQVLGDGRDVVHMFERECSLQRRRQKVWEEAPASLIPQQVRDKLCQAAILLAKSVHYRGAGTVEFLYDDETHAFYFIEMNTRIQVEHPVTEMITGIDLMREMIKVAGGEPLRFKQQDITANGHAIEVRINAEDPAQNFMPFPGVVSSLQVPGGPGVRFDAMIYPGYAIPPFYDSLLGKLIVWDENRSSAIVRMQRTLDELQIGGIKTTRPLFRALCAEKNVIDGQFDTLWLEPWLENNTSRLTDE